MFITGFASFMKSPFTVDNETDKPVKSNGPLSILAYELSVALVHTRIRWSFCRRKDKNN